MTGTTRVELWRLATDAGGPVVDGPRLLAPLAAGEDPREQAAAQAGEGARFLHSTSWRWDGSAVLLTFVAVLETPDAGSWQPLVVPAGRLSEGQPRIGDVLRHALRHLRWLQLTDPAVAAPLTSLTPVLQELDPDVAGLLPGPAQAGGVDSER